MPSHHPAPAQHLLRTAGGCEKQPRGAAHPCSGRWRVYRQWKSRQARLVQEAGSCRRRAHIISNKERAASQLRAHARAVTHAMDPRCISISSRSASLGRLAFGSSKGGHDMLLRLLRVRRRRAGRRRRRRRAGRRRRWRAEHIAPKHAIRIDMLLELAKVVQVISERANQKAFAIVPRRPCPGLGVHDVHADWVEVFY